MRLMNVAHFKMAATVTGEPTCNVIAVSARDICAYVLYKTKKEYIRIIYISMNK